MGYKTPVRLFNQFCFGLVKSHWLLAGAKKKSLPRYKHMYTSMYVCIHRHLPRCHVSMYVFEQAEEIRDTYARSFKESDLLIAFPSGSSRQE